MGKKILSFVAVCLVFAAPALAQPDAQPAPQDAKPQTAPAALPRQYRPDFSGQVVKTYYFSHLARPTELQDVVNAMRTILEIQRVQAVPERSALVVRGTEDQIARADKLIADLDQSRAGAGPATYKLEFTVHQFENGKKINDRSYAVIVERGRARDDANRYSLKAGSKIPVVTGSSSGGISQYNYVDIGMNFDCRLWGPDDGLMLQSTVEVSSLSMPQQGSPNQPTVRQAKADLVSPISSAKPVTIASFDEVDAPRRMDIEVTATKLR
jgi:hypothetical protein